MRGGREGSLKCLWMIMGDGEEIDLMMAYANKFFYFFFIFMVLVVYFLIELIFCIVINKHQI